MKLSLAVVTLATSYLAVFGPSFANGQSDDCVLQFSSIDLECVDGISSLAGNDTVAKTAFCDGPCARAVAQAYFNCGFNTTADVIVQGCTRNSGGDFCFLDVQLSDIYANLSQLCFLADDECTGVCRDAVLEVGCCIAKHPIPSFFSNCNSTYLEPCPPPFILDPPSLLPTSATRTDEPSIFDEPLFRCLNNKISIDSTLRQCATSGFGTNLGNIFSGVDPEGQNSEAVAESIREFCSSSCAKTVADAYLDCENKFGLLPELNISFAEITQVGCGKNNVEPSNFCLELFISDSYGDQIQSVFDGPCSNADCSNPACKDAVTSLGCCLHLSAQFAPREVQEMFNSCNIEACSQPFLLGGTTTLHSISVQALTVSALATVYAAL